MPTKIKTAEDADAGKDADVGVGPALSVEHHREMTLIRLFEAEAERQYKAAGSAATATSPPARRPPPSRRSSPTTSPEGQRLLQGRAGAQRAPGQRG